MLGDVLTTLVREHAWALWLGAPVLGITVVCLVVWWRGRPVRPVTTRQAMAGHQAYLDALVRAPRERVAPPVSADDVPGDDVVPTTPSGPGPAGPAAGERPAGGDPLATVRA